MLSRGISLLIGYACGLFLSGYMYGKKQNIDIRESGSGNVGTTNTLRTLGKRAGIFALIGDIFKAILAAVIVYFIYRNRVDNVLLLELYASFGAVLGHNFPFYFGFKGGKGIATSTGMIIVAFPETLPLCVLTMMLTVFITKYVSLGSILSSLVFAVEILIMGSMGLLSFQGTDLIEAEVIGLLAAATAIIKHRSNIKRLLNHEENKTYLFKKPEA